MLTVWELKIIVNCKNYNLVYTLVLHYVTLHYTSTTDIKPFFTLPLYLDSKWYYWRQNMYIFTLFLKNWTLIFHSHTLFLTKYHVYILWIHSDVRIVTWLELHMLVRHSAVMILQPAQKDDTGTCNWITRLMWPLRCTRCVRKVVSTTCVARCL